MFSTVLIANRGEIAIRVITACQEMGIRAVAVYSDADQNAAHVRAADAAYRIGPAPARESYLNIPAIIAAAKESGAEAIHPGYGFLSENAEFAEACAVAGIIFIGPPPEAIRLMGSKVAAKRAVEAAGVPTVPGYAGEARDLPTLRREAERVGFPLMIKASAGGGGKGMRVVRRSQDLEESIEAARREALAAFGDDSVFFERLVEAPRHIEFQMLADQYGDTIHLGERECSIQRRHQKVVEESPSIALTPALRAEMGDAAVRAAKAAGYVNAGTCEFLLDADGRYFFLEMNTRLQVEHPVTESVTGLDLVHHQLRIAAGEHLGIPQDRIVPRGHSIEVRLYAEDPANGYLPSVGRVLAFRAPRAPGVRVDAGIASGDEVSMHYDPMLAKLIVAAEDRQAAIERMRWLLDRTAVLGIASNLPLLRAIAADPDYAAGNTTTAFLDTHDLRAATEPPTAPPLALVAGALYEAIAGTATTTTAQASAGHPFNPWTSGGAGLGMGGSTTRVYTTRDASGEHRHTAMLTRVEAGYLATVDGTAFPAEGVGPTAVLEDEHTLTIALGHARATCVVARRGYDVLVAHDGVSYTLAKPRPVDIESAARGGESSRGAQRLVAPMAGTILKVNVGEGDLVEAQQTLVVLGAMKMEHAIAAPYAGRVRRLPVEVGAVVPGGEVLVELDSGQDEGAAGAHRVDDAESFEPGSNGRGAAMHERHERARKR